MFRSVSSSVTSRSTSTERSGADGFEEHGSDDFEKNEFNYGDGLRPWYPCYLTLDGGGVRSYSSLLIVKALMHDVWMWENRLADGEDDEEIATEQKQPKGLKLSSRVVKQTPLEKDLLPCHYFDFFYGTSSGGIIATLLGRLRMNIDDAIETFLNIMDAMYGDSARRHSLWPLSTKYSHGPLELFLNGLLGDAKFAEDRTAFSIDEPRTAQTCCLSATPSGFDGYGVAPAILLRTFAFYYSIDTPNWVTRYNEGATDLTVWQTLRATTATPFYFEATHFADAGGSCYQDGGIRENNPSAVAHSELSTLFETKSSPGPALLLSVGAGMPKSSGNGGLDGHCGPHRVFRHLPGIMNKQIKRFMSKRLVQYAEGERQHEVARRYATGEFTWYTRINVPIGMESIAMDDWSDRKQRHDTPGAATLAKIYAATMQELNCNDSPLNARFRTKTYLPRYALRRAAGVLVTQRRAREREGGPRWATFAGLQPVG